MNLFESTFQKNIKYLFEIKDTPNNIALFKKKYNFDDESKIKKIFQRFNQMVNNLKIKDIFAYKSLEDINSAINVKSKSEKNNKIILSGSEKVFSNERFLILNIKNQKASCKYGSGTKWCISGEYDNKWNQYYDNYKVTFYFVFDKTLPKNDPKYKVAVSVYPENSAYEIFDSKDNTLDVNDYFKFLEENGVNKNIFIARKIEYKIKDFLEKGSKAKKNSDGSYDVNGNVEISNTGLSKLPYIFNSVSGNLRISYNKNLISLEGCPKEIGGNFICINNKKLSSLEKGPKNVRGNIYNCSDNVLTSLEGCPEIINGLFVCLNNEITSLEGGPKIVKGKFRVIEWKLKSLDGCPKEVNGDFICSGHEGIQFTEDQVRKICKVSGEIDLK